LKIAKLLREPDRSADDRAAAIGRGTDSVPRWQYCGAYYLMGYAIECAFKAAISKQIKEHDFPDKKLVTIATRMILRNCSIRVA